MPRGPAERPIRRADDEAALQAAMRRALEQGAAAAVAGRAAVADPPAFGGQVAPPAPVQGASAVVRCRGARSIVLRRRVRKKDAAPPAADPRGRGGKLDVRG